jgi:polyferredoxin
LIDYATFEGAEAEKAGQPAPSIKRTFLRPRTLLYFSLWGTVGLMMLFALGARTRLDVSVQQDRNPVYVQLADGHVRNSYTVKVRNMEARPRLIRISLERLPGAVMWNERGTREAAGQEIAVNVAADSVAKTRVFVAAPRVGEQRSSFRFAVRGLDGAGSDRAVTAFERAEVQ